MHAFRRLQQDIVTNSAGTNLCIPPYAAAYEASLNAVRLEMVCERSCNAEIYVCMYVCMYIFAYVDVHVHDI